MDSTTLDRENVREASMRLPERQRVALELQGREGRSYEQIAVGLGVGVGAVAQLIARARINLYDELRGTALASVAAPSAECERALPLIAAREDGELDASSEDVPWLDSHLSGCDRCRLATEQMAEAAASYRAAVSRPDPPAAPPPPPDNRGPNRRRAALVGTALAALALGGLVAVVVGDGGAPQTDRPVTGAGAVQRLSDARPVYTARGRRAAAKRATESGSKAAAAVARTGAAGSASTPATTFAPEAGGGQSGATGEGGGSSGEAAVQPTRQPATSKPGSKSKPPATSTQASQPASQPTSESTSPPSSEETTPPVEEPTAEHGHKGEPPGRPTDRPPQK